MSSFLFALWQGGGNVPPQLAVAKRLVRRGHAVAVLAPRCVADEVAAAGARHVPYREAPEHDPARPELDRVADWKARTSMQGSARMRDEIMYGTALPIARDLLAEVEFSRPDAMVTDFVLLGGYLAAERAGLPLAVLVHTVYPMPAPGLPPPGLGLLPARGALGSLRDRLLWSFARRFYDARLDRLAAARHALGLDPVPSIFALVERADRVLVLTSAALDFPARMPANVRTVGMPEDPDAPPPWTPPGRPLVLASMSTTYQAQGALLRRVVEALGGLPVHGLVTTGPAIDPAALPGRPRISVARWVPHAAVLPHCDAVVTHAGHGTVASALRRGVPLVCAPMGRDQADVAARVVWHGAGVRIGRGAGAATIRAAVSRILGDPAFKAAAGRIATGMAAERGEAAAEELEALAARRLPAAA